MQPCALVSHVQILEYSQLTYTHIGHPSACERCLALSQSRPPWSDANNCPQASDDFVWSEPETLERCIFRKSFHLTICLGLLTRFPVPLDLRCNLPAKLIQAVASTQNGKKRLSN